MQGSSVILALLALLLLLVSEDKIHNLWSWLGSLWTIVMMLAYCFAFFVPNKKTKDTSCFTGVLVIMDLTETNLLLIFSKNYF